MEGADAQQSVAVPSFRPSPGIVRLDRMDLDRTWRLVACNLSQMRNLCGVSAQGPLGHLIEDGYDIRTIQELLGRKDVKTTMIYTHVLNRSGTRGLRSPADVLRRPSLTGLPDTRRRALQPNILPTPIPPSRQLESGEIVTDPHGDFDAAAARLHRRKPLFALVLLILSCCSSGQQSRPEQPSFGKQELAGYVRAHHMTPAEYVLSKFRTYDIVFLGEEHYIRQNVAFARDLIPALYGAGVYNLGIEFGADDYQPDVDRLITADHYDRDLARRIVFKHFVLWGYTDYIDIYRSAWEFNHSLPEGARRFRVVNLNYRPDWTALQGPRTHEVMLNVWFKGDPDVYMGKRVLHEFVDSHEKALIYAGFHHTFTHYHQPNYDFQDRKLIGFNTRRMGNVVYDAIPDRVFSILLHAPWISREGPGHWSAPVGGAIEAAMHGLQDAPAGFDVRDSPFGKLRDPAAYYSIGYPDFTLATLTDGYIYLVPFREFESVTVDANFITAANLQEAIDNFWDPEQRGQIKTPADLLRLIRNDADEVSQFRQVK